MKWQLYASSLIAMSYLLNQSEWAAGWIMQMFLWFDNWVSQTKFRQLWIVYDGHFIIFVGISSWVSRLSSLSSAEPSNTIRTHWPSTYTLEIFPCSSLAQLMWMVILNFYFCSLFLLVFTCFLSYCSCCVTKAPASCLSWQVMHSTFSGSC